MWLENHRWINFQACIHRQKYLQCSKIGGMKREQKKITEKHQYNFNLIASFCLCLLFRTIEYWFFTFSLGHCKKQHTNSGLVVLLFFSIFISWSGYKAKAKAKAMHSQKDHVCPVNIKCICVFVFVFVDSWMENIVYSNHISIVVYNMVNFKRSLVSVSGLTMFGRSENTMFNESVDIISP